MQPTRLLGDIAVPGYGRRQEQRVEPRHIEALSQIALRCHQDEGSPIFRLLGPFDGLTPLLGRTLPDQQSRIQTKGAQGVVEHPSVILPLRDD